MYVELVTLAILFISALAILGLACMLLMAPIAAVMLSIYRDKKTAAANHHRHRKPAHKD